MFFVPSCQTLWYMFYFDKGKSSKIKVAGLVVSVYLNWTSYLKPEGNNRCGQKVCLNTYKIFKMVFWRMQAEL